MREKLVKRYYCDFCKKAGLSKHHMQKHELHCTMNPDRKCRMCAFANGGKGPDSMGDLLALLPDPATFKDFKKDMWGNNEAAVITAINDALPALREKVDNCPACIMAALRQRGIDVPMATDFDFKSESTAIFAEHNSENYY